MKLEDFRQVVRKIPTGRVMTYGEVAAAAGHKGSARHVVWALRNSGPDVPWHRVIGAGGRILLPGEAALEQRLRLEAEGVAFARGRVDLKQQLQTKLGTPWAARRKDRSEAG